MNLRAWSELELPVIQGGEEQGWEKKGEEKKKKRNEMENQYSLEELPSNENIYSFCCFPQTSRDSTPRPGS